MKRLDVRLVELGLAPSRSKAQAMIGAGEVEIEGPQGWSTARQASQNTEKLEDARIRVKSEGQTLKYVSRGGLKLESALKRLKLSFSKETCALDAGLSTGGFADCLLQHGVGRVIGVDVGHGQLAERLKSEARVESFEGVNLRELPEELAQKIRGAVNFCVVDVSFVSLQQIFPALAQVLEKGTPLLALVKPQFEIGPQKLEPAHSEEVREQILLALGKCGFSFREYFASDVKGQDGTQEFFVYAIRD